MSAKFLETADYDDIEAVYDSVSFRLWRDTDKSNALIKLIKIGKTDEALFLIENNAFKLGYTNANKETAISVAIKTENAEVISALIEHGAQIDMNSIAVENPLFIAVTTGNISIIDLLLNNGASIQSTNNDGNNVLHYAVSSRNVGEVIAYLLEKNVSLERKNNAGETPLYYAVKTGKVDAAAVLIENGADINTTDSKKQNLYFAAVTSGSTATLDFVNRHNKDVDAINADNETPLLTAIGKNNARLVKRLLELRADIEKQTSTTPLWYAFDKAAGKVTDCLKVLVENGVNLDRKNASGQTVLISSVVQGYSGMVASLVPWGANLDLTDSAGITAVQYAVQAKNNTILVSLVAGGADLSIRNKNGTTLLHTCVELNSKEMIDSLLASKRLSADYASTSGVTAAMQAFQNNNPDMGNYLIQKGASLSAKDNSGKTLLTYRRTYYQNQITAANNQIASNNSTIVSLRNANATAESKIASLRIDEQSALSNYERTNREYEQAQKTVNSLESDAKYYKGRMDYFNDQISYWTQQYYAATDADARRRRQGYINDARASYNDYKRKYDSKNSELRSANITLAGKSTARSIAQIALSTVRNQISEQNSIISSNNSKINSLNSENTRLNQNIRNYQTELNRY